MNSPKNFCKQIFPKELAILPSGRNKALDALNKLIDNPNLKKIAFRITKPELNESKNFVKDMQEYVFLHMTDLKNFNTNLDNFEAFIRFKLGISNDNWVTNFFHD